MLNPHCITIILDFHKLAVDSNTMTNLFEARLCAADDRANASLSGLTGWLSVELE